MALVQFLLGCGLFLKGTNLLSNVSVDSHNRFGSFVDLFFKSIGFFAFGF